jgi:hypothetical protein
MVVKMVIHIDEVASEAIECVQCGKEFELSEKDLDQLAARGFDIPKRCPDCRRNKSRYATDDSHRRRRDKKKHYHNKYDRD